MLQLPNGCTCSNLCVTPKNWQTGSSSILKKDWFIQYYFHDPVYKEKYKNGFQAMVKGMNRYKTLAERKQATKDLLANELLMLENEGYNPITKLSLMLENSFEIDPFVPFILALTKTNEKLKIETHTKEDIKSVIKGMETSGRSLGYLGIGISKIKRRHIKNMLNNLYKINPKFSPDRFNKYRSYLSILFKELVQMEACEFNPVKEISFQKTVEKIRIVPTSDQMTLIDTTLKSKNYSFWRFCHIFFHSGARISELLKVHACDVDLENQRYKVIIKKGPGFTEVMKTITNIALPLWQEVVSLAESNDFLFSKGLVPGRESIRSEQITRRWKRHVKWKLEVAADFYSMKHLNTTDVITMVGEQVAANLNSHKNDTMVKTVYDVRRIDRKHEELKKVSNPFSSNG